MKKLLLFSAFILLAKLHTAQITVTNTTFPGVGDTLKTATDLNPNGVTITDPAGNATWDFSNLKISVAETFAFRPASEGSVSVPNANLFVEVGPNSEAYYKSSTTTFELIGFLGPDPFGLAMNTLYKFTPPLIERQAPLTYPAINTYTSALTLPFKTSDLPPFLIAILDSLPGPTPDSFRIKVNLKRTGFVDAWGKLTIPGGTYDVLREKSTEESETRIEIKVPFLGWWDITDLFPLPGAGGTTNISYTFWSNVAKEPIAVVNMDSTGNSVQQVTFKDNGVLTAGQEAIAAPPLVQVSPNPVTSVARFELSDLNPGNYTLRITDIRGAVLLEKNIRFVSPLQEQVDMSAFLTGTYFYILYDEKGAKLASGKVLRQ